MKNRNDANNKTNNVAVQLIEMLPHDDELEKAIIGEMLVSEDARYYSLHKLDSDDFYSSRNRAVFDAIRRCFVMYGDNLDVVTVANELKVNGKLDEVGGHYWLLSLFDKQAGSYVAGAANKSHAQQLEEISQRRKIVEIAVTAANSCYDSTANAKTIANTVVEEILSMRSAKSKGWQSMASLVEENVAQVQRARSNGISPGVPTGYKAIDSIIGGLKPRYYIVGGRTSMGKTSFAAGIARNIVEATGRPVGVFSLEMAEEMLANRDVAHYGKVGITAWSTYKFDDLDVIKERLNLSMKHLEKIYVDVTPGLSVIEMYSKLRQLLLMHPDLAAFVVDYVQLMTPGVKQRFENKNVELGFISSRMQQIIKMLNIPGIIVCQLSRETEKARGKRPGLQHLRESGSFEQDSDCVFLLFRRSYYYKEFFERQAEDGRMVDVAEVNIAKNKEGPTGYVEIGWDGTRATFVNLKDGGDIKRRTKKEMRKEDEEIRAREQEDDEHLVGRKVITGNDAGGQFVVNGQKSDTPF